MMSSRCLQAELKEEQKGGGNRFQSKSVKWLFLVPGTFFSLGTANLERAWRETVIFSPVSKAGILIVEVSAGTGTSDRH